MQRAEVKSKRDHHAGLLDRAVSLTVLAPADLVLRVERLFGRLNTKRGTAGKRAKVSCIVGVSRRTEAP